MIKSSGGFKRTGRGIGYPGSLRDELKLAILFSLAAFGWLAFGLNSVGTAVTATPLLFCLCSFVTVLFSILGGVIGLRSARSSPFLLRLGPLQLTWASQGIRIGTQRNTGWFGAMLLPTTRPGNHDSAPEGIAALARGSAIGSLVVASVACGLLYAAITARLGPLPVWGALVLTGAFAFGLVQSAVRVRNINRLLTGQARDGILATNAINSCIREGRRPASWPLQLFDTLVEADPTRQTLIAEANYVAYFALLDRGNVVAAGNRLDVASQAALQAMRDRKQTGEDFARIFAEMAYFSAFHRGDAERGRQWLDLCAEFWLEPSQRRRAEAAIIFGDGDVVTARALAERSKRDLADFPVFGDSLAEADWAAEIVRACDGEPQRPESIMARGRSSTVPPLVINAHGARAIFRLFPWVCLCTSLLLIALAASEVVSGDDASGVVWIALASPVVLLLSVFGFVFYMLIAHSWIELTAEGVGYVLSRKMHWLEWSHFRGWGKTARMPFAASGLILSEKVTLQKARGPMKRISGVPFSSFAPDWREGHIGAAIRIHAPHLLAAETKPPGWLM